MAEYSKVQRNIIAYLNYYGMSRAKLSKVSGLCEASLQKLLDGEQLPRLTQAARAMVVLGITAEDVLGEDECDRLLASLET